ncbi:arsenic transporter [Bacillus haikouensis]|uniref:arsenic transporter n=1 Tax=Bacillus haikouensis TaxID=1510468 RepID=UPI00155572F2|nr:arsenic transporter [Bacillus haikouensis]NQD66710.1 arsenic transporter [Bacillus haikouensis]
MLDSTFLWMTFIFSVTIIVMLWRPFGLNETIPTSIGAGLVLLIGIVPLSDVLNIFSIVSGASLTILSTIMMSIVLESIGFFKIVATNIVNRSRGSGRKLYLYVILLCFMMTMFFNNDGSILITTPIIIHITSLLKLKTRQKIPYLLSGALIATAASAPIAVSNISNLIALKIVGLSLQDYIKMMFVPSMIGIFLIALLLFLYFKKDIPDKILQVSVKWKSQAQKYSYTHPLSSSNKEKEVDWGLIKVCLVIVVLTRAAFFALTPFGISLEVIGLAGAAILILVRWFRTEMGIKDIFKKTPWHILLFAFNMYVLVYGLKNVGLNQFIVDQFRNLIVGQPLNASLIMGIFLTVASNLFNNLPAVMIGTLSITEMGLDPHILQIAYLANVIGSDIGALLTPVGTLATLIWMYILKSNGIKISWARYIKVTIVVIPIGLIVSLLSLYLWVELLS